MLLQVNMRVILLMISSLLTETLLGVSSAIDRVNKTYFLKLVALENSLVIGTILLVSDIFIYRGNKASRIF